MYTGGRLWDWFFTGGLDSRDALVDVVEQYPVQAVWFIKMAMMTGTVIGLSVSFVSLGFLGMYWVRGNLSNKTYNEGSFAQMKFFKVN
jgi:hypothetical protein